VSLAVNRIYSFLTPLHTSTATVAVVKSEAGTETLSEQTSVMVWSSYMTSVTLGIASVDSAKLVLLVASVEPEVISVLQMLQRHMVSALLEALTEAAPATVAVA